MAQHVRRAGRIKGQDGCSPNDGKTDIGDFRLRNCFNSPVYRKILSRSQSTSSEFETPLLLVL